MAGHASQDRRLRPSAARPGRHGALSRYSPWDDVGTRYPEWVVRVRDLHGAREAMSFRRKTILIGIGDSAAERRRSLAHAIAHIDLEHGSPGDVLHFEKREEAEAEQLAARRLIRIEALVDALRWALTPLETCAELDVDLDMLTCRGAHIHESERAQLRAVLNARCGEHV